MNFSRFQAALRGSSGRTLLRWCIATCSAGELDTMPGIRLFNYPAVGVAHVICAIGAAVGKPHTVCLPVQAGALSPVLPKKMLWAFALSGNLSCPHDATISIKPLYSVALFAKRQAGFCACPLLYCYPGP